MASTSSTLSSNPGSESGAAAVLAARILEDAALIGEMPEGREQWSPPGFDMFAMDVLAVRTANLTALPAECHASAAQGFLLVNWKHLLQHGYQLLFYLKLLGVPVAARA